MQKKIIETLKNISSEELIDLREKFKRQKIVYKNYQIKLKKYRICNLNYVNL